MLSDLAGLVRAESGRILSILVSQCQDIQLAEDVFQEACLQATQQWLPDNSPDNPRAWLLAVAKRRLIDRLRASTRAKDTRVLAIVQETLAQETLAQEKPESEEQHFIPDERLKLIFTCCHPALNQQAQVALTLKTLCGLSAREIARAYLVSEIAMHQRLQRAKQKIRRARISYQIPEPSELENRLESVLATIYLIYNESYTAFEGQTLTRLDLAEEAIRLARVLNQLLSTPSTAGLLALMLLHQARNPARSSEQQPFIPLELQNRAQWDKAKVSEGRRILVAALSQGKPEKYQLQAAISALHSEASEWAQTDWKQIYLLYKTLYEIDQSPIIKLNELVALAQLGKTKQALVELSTLHKALANYQPFHATKAEFNARLGNNSVAKKCYQAALSLTQNEAERAYLTDKLKTL